MPARHSESDTHHAREERFLECLNTLFAQAIGGPGRETAVLQATLDASVETVRAKRGFLALVNHETGGLEVSCTAGPGWTDENRRMRLHLSNETERGITGHVALSGKPYISGNVARDRYYLKYFDDVVSEIAVPILGAHGQTRGVINVDSEDPDAFDAEDAAHLSALAHCAAAALTLERFQSREAALIEIGKNLATTLDVDALTQKVVDVTATVLQFEDCSVFLLDE